MRNHTCPKRYSCYSYNHTDCDGCNDANTWYGPKPEKKVLLVGMTCKRGALAFMDVVLRQMSNRSIDVVFIDHDKVRFETTHTKVWFIWPDRVCYWLDGIRADGIFGEPYEEIRCRAKPDAVISSRDHIGLVDYICEVERSAKVDKIYLTMARNAGKSLYRHLLNSFYGISPDMSEFSERLKRQFEKNVNDAILKGENNMPTREERTYIHQDVASLVDAIVRNANTPKPKLPGIKTVHFSGPVTAVIWEDKTKTIVRCKDGEEPDYEKGLAMAIAKKALGTNKSGSNYYDIFKKWLPKPEAEEEPKEENQNG